MTKIIIAAVGLALVPASALRADQARVLEARPIAVAPAPGAPSFAVAPESWSRQDPADSLYRAARESMNRG
ncbi:MAG: hypothetical protein KY466_16935, partial [Gemmatimonadetes bacterium]|nr:hypothetical protein [Gemmatimonadota bacterium]